MKQKEQQERDFERLVERQRQTIYSVCYLFANERQQADDLFQEILIRLWKGFAGFEGRSSEKTWVYRVALNTCVTANDRMLHRKDTTPYCRKVSPQPPTKACLRDTSDIILDYRPFRHTSFQNIQVSAAKIRHARPYPS